MSDRWKYHGGGCDTDHLLSPPTSVIRLNKSEYDSSNQDPANLSLFFASFEKIVPFTAAATGSVPRLRGEIDTVT
jgi:hypothetical protein